MNKEKMIQYERLGATELQSITGGMLYSPYSKHHQRNRDFACGLINGLTNSNICPN